jgi:hypothetical protein
MDIANRIFTITSSLKGKSTVYPTNSLGTVNILSVFAGINRFNDTLYTAGTQTVRYAKYINDDLVETKIAVEAQLAMVDQFRSINKVPVLGPDPKNGLLHVIVGGIGGTTTAKFPVVNAYYWDLETQTNATYPIISPTDAWNAVLAGKGVVVNVTPKDGNAFAPYTPIAVNKVLVNKISLAYYETPAFQKFIQPIYVFEGNYSTEGTAGGNIVVYFPAVDGTYVKGNSTGASATPKPTGTSIF